MSNKQESDTFDWNNCGPIVWVSSPKLHSIGKAIDSSFDINADLNFNSKDSSNTQNDPSDNCALPLENGICTFCHSSGKTECMTHGHQKNDIDTDVNTDAETKYVNVGNKY